MVEKKVSVSRCAKIKMSRSRQLPNADGGDFAPFLRRKCVETYHNMSGVFRVPHVGKSPKKWGARKKLLSSMLQN